jgi:anti-anti-sigma regulatory factor
LLKTYCNWLKPGCLSWFCQSLYIIFRPQQFLLRPIFYDSDMSVTYKTLNVSIENGKANARLLSPELKDRRVLTDFFSDLELLAQLAVPRIRLDLSVASFLDGTVPGKLVGLAQALNVTGTDLEIVTSPGVGEVLRLLNLEQMLKLQSPEDPSALA